ncbi:hypothetical protein [Haliangium ochraceum]|uniref:hypothetical protein n=1 Tax=Haliangium ochraceum TaxID=80816 RepID=UPI001269CD81|nr:hypothetical protein [Haliangium ochraceum]
MICPGCRQECKVSLSWNQQRARPERQQQQPMASMYQPAPQASSSSRLWVLLLVALLFLSAGAVTLFVILPRLEDSKQTPPTNFFRDASSASAHLTRVLGFPPMAQKLTLYPTRAEAEVWNGDNSEAERLLVRIDGSTEKRRSNAERGVSFNVSEVNFALVPTLVNKALGVDPSAAEREAAREKAAASFDPEIAGTIEEARAAAGPQAEVHRISLERTPEGALQWSVFVDGTTGMYHLDYDASGERVGSGRAP